MTSSVDRSLKLIIAVVEETSFEANGKDDKAESKQVVVHVYLENVGDREMTVILGSDPEITLNENGAKIEFETDVQRSLDGALLKPSLCDLRSVTLRKGERTELKLSKLAITLNKGKTKIEVTYSISKELGSMYNIWFGKIEKEVVL